MKTTIKLLLLIWITILTSCVGDDLVQDFVEPQIRLSTPLPEALAVGEELTLDITYFNTVGQIAGADLVFESSEPSVATINDDGTLTALSKGVTTITVSALADGIETRLERLLLVDEETIVLEQMPVGGTIMTTSSYLLRGTFTIEEIPTGIRIVVAEDYEASTALPGLYVYLTNNRNTNVGALEIGRVQVFEGAHSYEVPGVSATDFSHLLYYCKPFSVKVGDGAIN